MKISIIGAGPGGYVAAIRSAQLGAEVTVIEKEEVGGTCLNKGCIPTKTLVASSNALEKARDLSAFGIRLEGEINPDMDEIVDRKDKVVSTQIKGIRALFKSYGINHIKGTGEFISPEEIRVTLPDGASDILSSDAYIIATGSRPANIPSLPFDGENIISSTEALSLRKIPESVLIVGAGVIGCEFAFIFRALGSEITVVDMLPRALSTEDEDISKLLERELKKKKIKFIPNATVDKVTINGGRVISTLSNGDELMTSKVLVSIGRDLNSNDLGLDKAGVKLGERGAILVDDALRTSTSNIYAVGDVTGGIMLAHVAAKEGMIAAENIMGMKSNTNYSVVPSAVFTSPEIASVGIREHDAIEDGLSYRTGMFNFRALGKAHAMGEIAGFIKIIVDKSTDLLLGAHIIGPHASDLIHEYALAMHNGITAADIADMIHAHPTLSEGLMEAAEDAHGKAIHAPKK